MPGEVVVDTNLLIAVLNGEHEATVHWRAAGTLILPATVLGEVLYGMRASARAAANEARLWELARVMTFWPCDQAVAQRYADVRVYLRRAGQPIPDNDLWIAATCLAVNAPLASRDAHFDHVPGLVRDEWR